MEKKQISLDFQDTIDRYIEVLDSFAEGQEDLMLLASIESAKNIDYWVVGEIILLDKVPIGVRGQNPAEERSIRIMRYDDSYLVELTREGHTSRNVYPRKMEKA